MAKTQVILTESIVGLGAESDQVAVAAGYARNYLFPRGMAIPLNAANKRRLEVLRQRRAEREAHDFNTMSELAKSLAKMVLILHVKTGEEGKLFGSVTAGSIVDELKHQFEVALDKKKIHLEHPIRALGDCDVELHLHPEVTTMLKVRVEGTTPSGAIVTAPSPKAPEPPPAVKPAAKAKAAGRPEAAKERSDRKPKGERKPKTPRAS